MLWSIKTWIPLERILKTKHIWIEYFSIATASEFIYCLIKKNQNYEFSKTYLQDIRANCLFRTLIVMN
jgi:hypothetical protein